MMRLIFSRILPLLSQWCQRWSDPPVVGILDGHQDLEGRIAGLIHPKRSPASRINRGAIVGLTALLLGAGLLIGGIRLGADPPNPPAGGDPLSEPAADPSKVRVEGVVLDEAGRPLAGVTVSVPSARQSWATTSGPDGGFCLVLDRPDFRYMPILASADAGRLQGLTRPENVSLTAAVVTCRVVVKPSRLLAVRVVDEKGAPVSEAAVGVFDDHYHLTAAETDARGAAVVRLPADSPVESVVALKPRLGMDYYENYTTSPPRTLKPPPTEVQLVLDGARTVRVTATDSAGKPLKGVDFLPWTVHKKGKLGHLNLSGAFNLKHAAAQSDDKGVAVLSWLPMELEGGVGLLSHLEGYHGPQAPYFDPARPAEPLTARLLRTVTIGGKVRLPDGKPAAGVLLQAEGAGSSNDYFRGYARTDAEGAYRFQAYPDQGYIVAVISDEWAAPSHIGVVVREGQPAATGLDFTLARGTLLHGTVTVGEGKKPAAGETVGLHQIKELPASLKDEFHSDHFRLVRWATADKEGKYALRLGPGRYAIHWPPGREVEELTITNEEKIERNFHLPRPLQGRIGGVVRAKTVDGPPVAGAILKTGPIGSWMAVADNQGRFQGERPLVKMLVHASNPQGTLATLIPVDEDEADVTILLTEAGGVQGRLLDGNGRPAADVLIVVGVQLGPRDASTHFIHLSARTDREGRFRVGGLILGANCFMHGYVGEHTLKLKEWKVEKAEALDLGDITFR